MSSDQRLNKKIDQQSLLEELDQLSGSELNSFLLKLFDRRTGQITPAQVMKQYSQSRFVKGVDVDPIAYKRFELQCLEIANQAGFEPVLLSPLTPLGTCSAMAEVDQKLVVSASRGTEVASDITNILALKIAQAHKASGKTREVMHLASTHRLVRAQDFGNPAYAAHFGLLALVSGGFDQGSFSVELDALIHHLNYHLALIKKQFSADQLYTRIMLKEQDHPFNDFLRTKLEGYNTDTTIEIIQEEEPNNYYKFVQYKTFLKMEGEDLNLSDGGLVDWTQKLIANKKHRCFISATGIELLYKFAQPKA